MACLHYSTIDECGRSVVTEKTGPKQKKSNDLKIKSFDRKFQETHLKKETLI